MALKYTEEKLNSLDNESEAIAAEDDGGRDSEAVPRRKPKKKQGKREFERYGLHISRQNMANWTIQCADRYLAVLYDYLHEKIYGYHVLQADETPELKPKGKT